jgi:hypothetical protein
LESEFVQQKRLQATAALQKQGGRMCLAQIIFNQQQQVSGATEAAIPAFIKL